MENWFPYLLVGDPPITTNSDGEIATTQLRWKDIPSIAGSGPSTHTWDPFSKNWLVFSPRMYVPISVSVTAVWPKTVNKSSVNWLWIFQDNPAGPIRPSLHPKSSRISFDLRQLLPSHFRKIVAATLTIRVYSSACQTFAAILKVAPSGDLAKKSFQFKSCNFGDFEKNFLP